MEIPQEIIDELENTLAKLEALNMFYRIELVERAPNPHKIDIMLEKDQYLFQAVDTKYEIANGIYHSLDELKSKLQDRNREIILERAKRGFTRFYYDIITVKIKELAAWDLGNDWIIGKLIPINPIKSVE